MTSSGSAADCDERSCCTEFDAALKEMDQKKIERFVKEEGCEWVMNPPHTSHFGGVWERQPRRSPLEQLAHGTSVQNHMQRGRTCPNCGGHPRPRREEKDLSLPREGASAPTAHWSRARRAAIGARIVDPWARSVTHPSEAAQRTD